MKHQALFSSKKKKVLSAAILLGFFKVKLKMSRTLKTLYMYFILLLDKDSLL